MRHPVEGIRVLEPLVLLAREAGHPLSQAERLPPISDYRRSQCKSIVVVRIGDLLRS